jgi:hypothetical protein
MSNGTFKNDLLYGIKYEERTQLKILDKYNYKIIKISQGNSPKYDFKALDKINKKKIKYEVKTTSQEYQTIFIEFKNGDNEASGINKTTSHFYIFVDVSKNEDDNEKYYSIQTTKLKKIIEENTIKIIPNRYNNAWGYIVKKNIIIAASVEL